MLHNVIIRADRTFIAIGQIGVQKNRVQLNQTVEDMAVNVMLLVSGLFDEAFPDQWRDAMTGTDAEDRRRAGSSSWQPRSIPIRQPAQLTWRANRPATLYTGEKSYEG
jgi:hypothetical protein